jgi:hypothetical protein
VRLLRLSEYLVSRVGKRSEQLDRRRIAEDAVCARGFGGPVVQRPQRSWPDAFEVRGAQLRYVDALHRFLL